MNPNIPTRESHGFSRVEEVKIKEINDNRYYYWQWRDGDRIKSKYKGPVSSDEQ
ncbi:hypothetical protein [Natronomonas pharaonis]|uniref:hypothetical protein n=1 Tax=Natronomonas pharaonis TaxID=2257 RepID=UPI0013053C7F|nr:hypothetical protein [Natronomonas pharaonis]